MNLEKSNMSNTGHEPFAVHVDYCPVINYSLYQNGVPFVTQIRFVNGSEQEYQDIDVSIEFSPPIARMNGTRRLDVRANDTSVLRNFLLEPNEDMLASLNERVSGRIVISFVYNDVELQRESLPVDLLAYDECFGFWFMPEFLSSFSQPNHPDVAKLLFNASKLLGQWTGSPALDAYQSEDKGRVRLQIAAIYGALQQCNITYAPPPAGFEKLGQRIRTADEVLSTHLGTCLDLSLLYTACLEAAGLNPLLVVVKGHAFIGVWLESECFPESVQDDASIITKRIASGIGSICLVETTTMCAGKQVDFEHAELAGIKNLTTCSFEFLVDIRRSRSMGIRPLPQRKRTESGMSIVHEERSIGELTSRPAEMESTVAVPEKNKHKERSKIEQWQRKLLDLSKRNALISLRITRNMLPILTHRLDKLEDALQSGQDFRLLPKSADWGIDFANDTVFELTSRLSPYEEALLLDFQSGQIRIPYTEAELQKSIVQLYRSAKVSEEENGANTLYLALGALKWFDAKNSTMPRYAPIILLPVDIIRKSARNGYVIRLRDDEPQMNITLLELLKQDYGIEIAGLEPLPQDEHGLDLRAILSIMRHGVMHMSRWDVVESAFLGIFSFSQFVMWNDLKHRSEDLKKSKIVQSLGEGKLTWSPEPLPDHIGKEGTLLPIASDGSQLKAIEAAANGMSFVLHGPPGTGKSQTITAMIANALAQGKTVLFVAAKMAALSVVKKRLDAIGIGPFCLELHSNKARKKDVLSQLEKALQMAGLIKKSDYIQTKAQREKLCAELDVHRSELHKQYLFGASLYEAIARYEQHAAAPSSVVFSVGDVNKWTADKVRSNDRCVDELISAARLVGHPHGHPLNGIGLTDYTQQSRKKADESIKALIQAIDKLDSAAKLLSADAGKAFDGTYAHILPLLTQADELLSIENNQKQQKLIETDLTYRFDKNVLTMPLDELYPLWQKAKSAWFVTKINLKSSVKKQLKPLYKEKKLEDNEVDACLDALKRIRDHEANHQISLEKLPKAMAEQYLASLDHAHKLMEVYAEYEAKRADLVSALKPVPGWVEFNQVLREMAEQLALWSAHLDVLKDYAVWNYTAERARENDLSPLVVAIESGLLLDVAKDAYQRGLYKSMAEAIFELSEHSSRFNGILFEEKVNAFKKLDGELCKQAQHEIVMRLIERLPNLQMLASHNSELGILQRAIKSGGRGLSIRRLMEQLPTLLPILCPCMLMSPISTAQYLDPQRPPFDMVIFDEASQVPTSEAIGALARAREAVIVGDPKQMPPTSFFATNTADEDHPELEDLESILDDCLALTMPDTHLKWHYRSRHESLIAFSNREYYGDGLYTFPSPDALSSMVRLVSVDGFYDRGKTRQNRAEAEAIISEIKRRLIEEPNRSIGVVTFSIVQQNLIDDLLCNLFIEMPELETAAFEKDERLFVKNLENVQGDERDVILFSVGYGPDQDGMVAMNFGPLNRDSGWRRLNVAITRAREEMVLFAVLRPEQIDLHRTHAKGVENLKAFLEFAQNGNRTMRSQNNHLGDGIAQSISKKLEERSYHADIEVGFSKFRVDVGIVDPKDPSRYVLGILLDGDTYAQATTVSDREVSNGAVLVGLGWHVLRIYAIDWWENPERELKRIISAIEGALDQAGQVQKAQTKSENEHSATIELIKNAEQLDSDRALLAHRYAPMAQSQAITNQHCYELAQLPCTQMSADAFITNVSYSTLAHYCRLILEKEAPIVQTLIVKRVLAAHGISRAGSRVSDKVVAALRSLDVTHIQERNEVFYYPCAPGEYRKFRVPTNDSSRRDARELPTYEVANAAESVLKQQFSLPRDELVRETTKLLGYARAGNSLNEAINLGIDKLLELKRANTDDANRIYLMR